MGLRPAHQRIWNAGPVSERSHRPRRGGAAISIRDQSKLEPSSSEMLPTADEGTKAALTSLTFNAGDKWARSGLGAALRQGDIEARARAFFAVQQGWRANFTRARSSACRRSGLDRQSARGRAPGSPVVTGAVGNQHRVRTPKIARCQASAFCARRRYLRAPRSRRTVPCASALSVRPVDAPMERQCRVSGTAVSHRRPHFLCSCNLIKLSDARRPEGS